MDACPKSFLPVGLGTAGLHYHCFVPTKKKLAILEHALDAMVIACLQLETNMCWTTQSVSCGKIKHIWWDNEVNL